MKLQFARLYGRKYLKTIAVRRGKVVEAANRMLLLRACARATESNHRSAACADLNKSGGVPAEIPLETALATEPGILNH